MTLVARAIVLENARARALRSAGCERMVAVGDAHAIEAVAERSTYRRHRSRLRRAGQGGPEQMSGVGRMGSREVRFRSLWARIAWAAAALVLGVVGTWLAWSPLRASSEPVPETAIRVAALDGEPVEAYDGVRLSLFIDAYKGCENPVRVFGAVQRSDTSWTQAAQRPDVYDKVAVAAEGMFVRGLRLGVHQSTVTYLPTAGEDLVESGGGTFGYQKLPLSVNVSEQYRVEDEFPIPGPPADAVARVVEMDGWERVRSEAVFLADADLVYPAGYERCAIAVPALTGVRAISAGEAAYERIRDNPFLEDDPPSDVVAATVEVAVSDARPVEGSAGGAALVQGEHVLVACREPNAEAKSRWELEALATSDCGAAPVFQVGDPTSQSNSRIFVAGLLLSLALALLIETVVSPGAESDAR